MEYIPKRPHGKPSYAPLLASEGRVGLSLGADLRAGNFHPSTGARLFLQRTLAKLPASVAATRTRVRIDAAFHDKALVHPLDEARVGYATVARMTEPLRQRMVAARYHEFARGWEAAEFAYTPSHWKGEHRFIAVRRPAALEPEDSQRRLFTFRRHTYHRALVTNLQITSAAVYRFCCDRGFQELLLREFKDAYALARIPTRSFSAIRRAWRWSSGRTIWSWRFSSSACLQRCPIGTS